MHDTPFNPFTTPIAAEASTPKRVAIIGGGLAGLACAWHLQQAGIDWHLFEAQPHLGGRVHTHTHETGFLLDAGFQVLNTAYDEAQPWMNDLNLRPFYAGAMIRHGNRFHKLGDPRRDRSQFWHGFWSTLPTLGDKLKVLQLQALSLQLNEAQLFELEEQTTHEVLTQFGFSPRLIERFFTPFFGGVFLEEGLKTSFRKFLWAFQTFVNGQVCLPAQGMQALPQLIASQLPHNRLFTNVGLQHLSPPNPTEPYRTLLLSNGQTVPTTHVVLAMDIPSICNLVGQALPVTYQHTQVFYFSKQGKLPNKLRHRCLWLNGNTVEQEPIQHLCFPSEVAPSYAPPNHQLMSVTLKPSWTPYDLDEATLVASVKQQLSQWFGKKEADLWHYLQRVVVPCALPSSTLLYGTQQATLFPWQQHLEATWQVQLAGDFMDTASINGALRSGRLTAERLTL